MSEHPYKAHGQFFTKQLVNGRYFSIRMDDAKKIITRIPKGFRTFEAELTIKTIQRCRLKVQGDDGAKTGYPPTLTRGGTKTPPEHETPSLREAARHDLERLERKKC